MKGRRLKGSEGGSEEDRGGGAEKKMMRGFSKKAWPAYGCAIFYTLFLFSSIPFVRPFQKFVYNQYGKSYFGYFVLVAIVLCLIGCVFYLIKNADRGVSTKNYLWLAGVTGLYVYFTLKLWKFPEEAIHFLEYGLLSYLFYRALRHHVKDITIYFTVAFIALFLGTIDEMIQWAVPVRYWDFRDVGLNFLAGGLLQLGLWKGIRPAIISERVKPCSIKILSAIVALCSVSLGLCASNTPSRVLFYTEKLPALSFLRSSDTMMREYGYKHRDPGIDVFYSRYTKEELMAIDREKESVYSKTLNESLGVDYGQFLKTYNSIRAPFLYEMRVHIFQRDRYLNKGLEAQGARHKEWLTIAYKENLILEKYFGQTLRRTGYWWPDSKKGEMGNLIDPGSSYESPVSSELLTVFTERDLWTGIGLFLCVLLGINIYVGRFRYKRQ